MGKSLKDLLQFPHIDVAVVESLNIYIYTSLYTLSYLNNGGTSIGSVIVVTDLIFTLHESVRKITHSKRFLSTIPKVLGFIYIMHMMIKSKGLFGPWGWGTFVKM